MVIIRLKEIAESKNIKMTQLQKRTGLDVGVVRRYWRNETRSVDLQFLDKLCDFLNVTPGDLIERVAVTDTEP
jgi:DNA-binding Xre family transcriptional regulator